MKNLIATVLICSCIQSYALTEKIESTQVGYKCALGTDNMIGLGTEYTIMVKDSYSKILLSTLVTGGYQIETARTHDSEVPKLTMTRSEITLEARFYSPEDGAFIMPQTLTVDEVSKILTVQSTDKASPIVKLPCTKIY